MDINFDREEIADLIHVLGWNITGCLGVASDDVIDRRKAVLSKLEGLLEQM